MNFETFQDLFVAPDLDQHEQRFNMGTNQYARLLHPNVIQISQKLPQIQFPNVSDLTSYFQTFKLAQNFQGKNLLYFELLIIKCLPISQIQIGLCSSSHLATEPLPASVSYRCDGQLDNKQLQPYTQGDTVGLCIFGQKKVVFTLNGQKIYELDLKKEQSQFFPAICLTCQSDTVRLQLQNFKYDISAYLNQLSYSKFQQICKQPQVSMEPIVLQYLKQYGYNKTLATLVKPDKQEQQHIALARKMTMDDSDTTSLKILQADSIVENQARKYIDEMYNSLFGSYGQLDDEVQIRQRSRSIALDLKSLMQLASPEDQDIANRGFLRSLLRDRCYAEAREFINESNIEVQDASLFALEFIHKFKTNQDLLEMIGQNMDRTFPTKEGNMQLSKLMGLLCYQGGSKDVGSLSFLLEHEQEVILIDRVISNNGSLSNIETMLKHLLIVTPKVFKGKFL